MGVTAMGISQSAKASHEVYEKFKYLYQHYSSMTTNDLGVLYHENIQFKDPVHTLYGLNNLISYFEKINKNTSNCSFEFVHEVVSSEGAYITWDMIFSHPKIAGGSQVTVRGMTHIKMRKGKIVYHEDSYDLGAMIYEHIPLVGYSIKSLKKRLVP